MLLRKVMALVILSVYALSSSGTSLYLHYCCGTPHVMAINEKPETYDPCCSEAEHHEGAAGDADTCEAGTVDDHGCKDVYWDTVDATHEHITYGDRGTHFFSAPAEISLPFSVTVSPFVTDGVLTFYADSSPPAVSETPLFILHCTYRI